MAKTESKPDSPTKFAENLLVRGLIVLGVLFLVTQFQGKRSSSPLLNSSARGADAPLVMQGGDPYIRALMRTISASESNVSNPYSVVYGGERISDLRQHPDRCITIVAGPNIGDCTTAAGRYQFITTTWLSKARRYHPSPYGFMVWSGYSFEPEYQDEVVYRWLNDRVAWGDDVRQLLKDGKIHTVLEMLSGTWTSLGYGIEDNSMSSELPRVYQRVLREELKQTASRS
ncbi:glycoside hydrolase family protein [Myxacorys almedinensis]|uniref:Glycoside hydrolase family protein n=1 Tax=Myxacorys almedinensis A TaxID=2690445 RepID=A0A8J8CLN7_9CYAN|nr:glycoside hydrolase family protein [Myxacorys almedinensis]NDJ16322.1 glycoside hydrolase family protein [Myxacorys almedinensis A]